MFHRCITRFARAIVPQLLLMLTACSSAAAPPPPTGLPTAAAVSAPPTATVAPTAVLPTATVAPTEAVVFAAALAAPLVPTLPAAATLIPTPTPRPYGIPPRIGIQIGHLDSAQLPDELARLRTSTGAFYADIQEYEVNQAVAIALQRLLEANGITVDLLPATVPPAYQADAFLAIHADGAAGSKRGWKIATPWRASRASQELLNAISATYGAVTGIPQDSGGVTVNMRGYYAFSYRRHVHAIAPTTPAVIVEIGFLSSAADRAVIVGQPELVARGIAEGVLDYLRLRDPRDGAGLVPPQLPGMRAREGAVVRRAPREDAAVAAVLPAGTRVVAFQQRDGWYEMFARLGDVTHIGWLRTDEVEITNEPFVMPTATNANP